MKTVEQLNYMIEAYDKMIDDLVDAKASDKIIGKLELKRQDLLNELKTAKQCIKQDANESPKTIELYKALSKARKKYKQVKKVSGHKHKYAKLEDIVESVSTALEQNDIMIDQRILPLFDCSFSDAIIKVKLIHLTSGQWISSSAFIIPGDNANMAYDQRWGSSRTYKLRYVLQTILGTSSDDLDHDAVPYTRQVNYISVNEQEYLKEISNESPQRKKSLLNYLQARSISSITKIPKTMFDDIVNQITSK